MRAEGRGSDLRRRPGSGASASVAAPAGWLPARPVLPAEFPACGREAARSRPWGPPGLPSARRLLTCAEPGHLRRSSPEPQVSRAAGRLLETPKLHLRLGSSTHHDQPQEKQPPPTPVWHIFLLSNYDDFQNSLLGEVHPPPTCTARQTLTFPLSSGIGLEKNEKVSTSKQLVLLPHVKYSNPEELLT